MKALAILVLILLPGFAMAQKVDLEKMEDGTTTYEISKNKKVDSKIDNAWKVEDGTADVTGESALMSKEATANWKTACNDWKKEFRADNKDNKIITISCGKAECSTDATGKTCTSKATYKIKTKVN